VNTLTIEFQTYYGTAEGLFLFHGKIPAVFIQNAVIFLFRKFIRAYLAP
jgi:hypothetical protein